MNNSKDVGFDSLPGIVKRLRDHAADNEGPGAYYGTDPRLYQEAADMLEFFFGQMQMHSPDMGGQHSYRFCSGGWPMTHCKGPNAENAVRAAIEEIKRERDESA